MSDVTYIPISVCATSILGGLSDSVNLTGLPIREIKAHNEYFKVWVNGFPKQSDKVHVCTNQVPFNHFKVVTLIADFDSDNDMFSYYDEDVDDVAHAYLVVERNDNGRLTNVFITQPL
jgi:hypothetical protein